MFTAKDIVKVEIEVGAVMDGTTTAAPAAASAPAAAAAPPPATPSST